MQVDVAWLARALASDSPPQLLDCREAWELELGTLPGAIHVPLGEIPDRGAAALVPGRPVVVFCHHGIRSLSGARWLRDVGFDAVSLSGGTDAWSVTVDPTLPRY